MYTESVSNLREPVIKRMLKFLVLVAFQAAIIFAGPVPSEKVSGILMQSHLSPRIINGSGTTIEEHPYQISLMLKGEGHMCGGSIISKNWVLTAAHCVDGVVRSDYIVASGMTDMTKGGTLHRIARIITHSNFGLNDYGIVVNDIALIRVIDPFEYDEKHQAIPLFAVNENIEVGSVGVVTGWGLDENKEYPDILKAVEIPVISKERCNQLYKYVGGLEKGEFCAAYEDGMRDSCVGDSGGPFAIQGRLAGVVSWGIGCADPEYPGVYTEVATYRNWIKIYSGV